MGKVIATGVVHKVPVDLRKVLTSDQAALAKWEDITPLARNEWICSELIEGMRRPCCWAGCPHR